MANETMGKIEVGGLPQAIAMQAEHDPAPGLDLVPNPNRDGGIGLVKVGPENWAIHELKGPREHALRHRFEDLGTFAAWLIRSAVNPDQAQVFVDIAPVDEKREIVGRLNPRDLGGDVVSCAVNYSPEFEAWVDGTVGQVLNQRTFFKLIRGYGNAIATASLAESLLGTLAALRIVTNGDFECTLAPNGRTTVAGARADVNVSKELPAEIELSIPIFEGVDVERGGGTVAAKYSLRAMLDVEASHDGLAILISFPDLPSVMRAATRDLVAHVQRSLGSRWLVCQGRENAADVPMIDHTAPRAIGSPSVNQESVQMALDTASDSLAE